MKKLFTLFVVLLFAVMLTACQDKILADEEHDYYLTGAFAGWGDATEKEEFRMEAIGINDARVASLKDQLKGAVALYIIENTFAADQEWGKTYKVSGTVTEFNGGLVFKVIRTDAGDPIPNWWAQSPESGKIDNLTPNTLYMPPFVEENVDQAGAWNDDPVIKTAGTYYMVFAVFANSKAVGAIAK